ncbi:(Fe-S)-binding protein [Desulfuribacillus alkaliarsenatis]|uniref:Fe-S oxidoreductase n=1 Tax=Desulfuribacillus alkaliarsenatis TaxID=766136 RepID=A0A1E5G6E4_9FIRM|nr:(Fe-S)-binding protein [Desulfuribacillus alkaliarsenatis]OEF98750.1 Fe-S oxidoreductase [Desulfuribacillus alkaliarsenatis]
MKVALLGTCIADMFYPQAIESTYKLLKRQGVTVDYPEDQICCGQPSFNSGYFDEAARVAKHLIKSFEKTEYIITPSGSCAAMIRDNYPRLFKDDPQALEQAKTFANKVYEFSEFFVKVLGVKDLGAKYDAKVTYHHSCHMSRLLRIKDAPVELIKNIEGVEYVELPNNQDCCGFGGTFSVKMADISSSMLNEKIENVKKTGAEILVGSDLSCLMNISGGLSRQGINVKTMHVAELLDRGLQ